MSETHTRILCAAIAVGGTVICGRRHFDPIMSSVIRKLYPDGMPENDQGFIDSDGRYLSREEALIVAKEAGQLLRKTGNEYELFSEDLY